MTLRVVVFNASPHMDKGNTALILSPFLGGMKEAGASIEVVYTKKLRINPCLGCFSCWLKTPGRCVQKDDVANLLSKFGKVDIAVMATPVYVDGMAGSMKNFLDRLIPMVEPFIELRDGHCRHPARSGKGIGKIVLVASCGFWEMDNFEPLVVHIKAICRNTDSEYSGALLRPHSAALKAMLETGTSANDVVDAAKDAGRQLVQSGRISADTLSTVSRELLPLDKYIEVANQRFKEELDKLKK